MPNAASFQHKYVLEIPDFKDETILSRIFPYVAYQEGQHTGLMTKAFEEEKTSK